MGTVSDKLVYLNETKSLLREAINAILADRGDPLLTESDPFRQFAAKIHPVLSLYQNGEQGAWYDPSDLTTLYQDSAGTTPVTADGDPVGLMLDKSGNGNHVSQSVAAARPIYRTDGTLHWLEFDGVDDFLQRPSPVVSYSEVFLCLASENTKLGAAQLNSGIADGTAQRTEIQATSVNLTRAANAAGSFSGLDAGRSDTANITSNHRLGGVFSARYNGVEVASTQLLSNTIISSDGAIYVGRSPVFPTVYAGLKFFGSLLVISPTQLDDVLSTEQYLATKAGVTL